jgi:hypothetical protein
MRCRNKFGMTFRASFLKKGDFEGDYKPSSVIPIPRFSENREDGHLSRTLIAQGLKRPHPSRLCSVLRSKFEWAFLISPSLAGRNGTYLVLLRVGFTKLVRSLGILVSSYLAFSPLPCGMVISAFHRAVCFLWHFPYPRILSYSFQEQSVLRTTLPCGARTFLPS